MTEKEILEIIEGCGCRECGAIHGYEEHEQTQKESAKKIFNAMQVTLGLPSVTYCGCISEGSIRVLSETTYMVCKDCDKPLNCK